MLKRLWKSERGSVLVIFAVGVPTFIILAALALDVGNWYAHKRQVQNQVDAAVLAAGVAYGYNFPACTTSTAATDNIVNTAKQYSGNGSPAYNLTAGAVIVNADPCQPHSPGDYASPDGTMRTDVQVKESVTSLFGGFGFVPTITANARVAVMQLESATGFRPLAIANPGYDNGECAWATFGDSAPVDLGTPDAPGHWHAENVAVHTENEGLPVSVTTGDCGVPSQQITYPDVGYVGVYDHGGATTEPQLQDLFFSGFGPDCDGLYVSRYATAGCSFLISASFSGMPSFEITSLTADINGAVTFTGAGDDWQATVPASQLLAGSGSLADGLVRISLAGTYLDHTVVGDPELPLSGLNDVHQIMAGNDQFEGPIKDFTLSQTTADKNADITETIDLTLDTLTNAGPLFVLRARDGQGDRSLNGTVDCADGQTVELQITRGCRTPVPVHPSSSCATGSPPPSGCLQGVAPTGNILAAYNGLWAPGGVNCPGTPNNWPNDPANIPSIPRGDPRLITVPVTRVEGAFGPGDNHPVVSFAAFYVTGWAGMPGGCGDPLPPATATLGTEVWGHFIRFVEPSGAGTPLSVPCQVNSDDIAACIATLVQ